MPGLLGYAAAGALAGGGQALEEQADEELKLKREAALEAVRQQNREILLNTREAGANERNAATIKGANERSDATLDIRKDEEKGRNTRAEAKNRTAMSVARVKRGTGYLSTDEKRVVDMVVKRHTTAGIIDDKAVRKQLAQQYPNILRKYAPDAGPGGITQDEARQQARKEADERTGIFKGRKEEFPETGGDRARWEANRTRELMGQPPATQPAGKDKAAAGTPAPGQTSNTVDITGTPAEQRRKLEAVPVGGVARINGVLYERKEGGFAKLK